MKLHTVSCDGCGYKKETVLTPEQARELPRHRCRICLKKDPKSQFRFKVKETEQFRRS